ncbi:MAG: O-methyltransferase [Balneolales bacterium]|nr:O-methyltransferase [Balneolales bacterium]
MQQDTGSNSASEKDDLRKYALAHSGRESEALQFIVKATSEELEYDDMLSGPQVGGLLRLLIQTGGFSKILEVGMFTGYATLSIAEVLPDDGSVTCLEMNTLYASVAARGFAKAGLGHKITVIMGNARETVQTINGTYDLIFIDADKQYYPEYYKCVKPLLRKGGIIVADNVFWYGGVLTLESRKSKAIDEFNALVAEDLEMESVMLDIRDGLLIARKK